MTIMNPTRGDAAPTDIDWAYKALADPIRRSLMETLRKKQYFCRVDGEKVNGICVQDLSSLLQLPQSTVSRHLAVLRQAGLVGHRQNGIWHYYFCNIDRIRAVQQWLDSLVTEEESGVNIP
ncbi:MAG: ArsR/SmtB family transcription factor [Bacilli bacterium]